MGAGRTPQHGLGPCAYSGSARSAQGYASPVTRSTRGVLPLVFVVLAIVSLASIAVAPRGVVRAAVAASLDLRVSPADSTTSIGAPDDDVELPGVRAVVSKEEQDPNEAVGDALETTVPGASLAVVPRVSAPIDLTSLPTTHLASTSATGDRAPPSSI